MRNSTVDYSPLSIFQNADPIVQAIIVGLVLASIVSWWVILDRALKIRAEWRSIRLIRSELSGPFSLMGCESCANVHHRLRRRY